MDVKTVDAGLLQSRYRLTKQRDAILRALETGGHVTAETLHGRVRATMPGVSLGTIYRTLDILREIGLVQVFSFAGSAARYEAAIEKHHHLVCTVCRDVSDVRSDAIGTIAREIAEDSGFDRVDFSLTIVGRCRPCARP